MKKFFAVLLSFSLCMAMMSCDSKKAETQQNAVVEEIREDAEITFPIKEMPAFVSEDMDGNEVTNEIFQNADLTLVNFWGTFCGPCINEMTELAKWKLPENVQFIGIMIDVYTKDSEEFKMAEKIIAETGVTYQNIMISKDFDKLYEQLVGVPTTFFVDKEGKIIADPIIGANVVEYKQFVKDYLNGK